MNNILVYVAPLVASAIAPVIAFFVWKWLRARYGIESISTVLETAEDVWYEIREQVEDSETPIDDIIHDGLGKVLARIHGQLSNEMRAAVLGRWEKNARIDDIGTPGDFADDSLKTKKARSDFAKLVDGKVKAKTKQSAY